MIQDHTIWYNRYPFLYGVKERPYIKIIGLFSEITQQNLQRMYKYNLMVNTLTMIQNEKSSEKTTIMS